MTPPLNKEPKMTEHTVGPWSLDDSDLRDEAQMVLSDRTGCLVADAYLQARGGECEANARLIATAPDLLDGCLVMLAAFSEQAAGDAMLEAVSIAKAAIARATGGQP